jgi:hypothetical protein
MPFVYQPETLVSIADKMDVQATNLDNLVPSHPVNMPQSEIDAHRAKLDASAATYRAAAHILRERDATTMWRQLKAREITPADYQARYPAPVMLTPAEAADVPALYMGRWVTDGERVWVAE